MSENDTLQHQIYDCDWWRRKSNMKTKQFGKQGYVSIK